jgi:hypothetical protein
MHRGLLALLLAATASVGCYDPVHLDAVQTSRPWVASRSYPGPVQRTGADSLA